jgi:hypothetical protein
MSSPNLKPAPSPPIFVRAFGADATNADSFQPFLDLMLKMVLDNQRALAGALSDEPNVCALLALAADSVGLGHHFFYDGATWPVASEMLDCIVHSPRPPALPPPNCIFA